jgi:hypothetical protein
MTIGLVLVGDPSSKLLVRNLTITSDLYFAPGTWLLNAPGNGVARDTPFGQVTAWTGISAIGGLRGSSAVLHFANQHDCAALWFRHELEVSDIRIKSESKNVLSLEINTNFAGDLGRISSASIDLFDLDLGIPGFQDFPELFQTWLRQTGHSTPQNPPAWIGSASIYEAQVGFWVFTPTTVTSLMPTLPR